MTHPLIFLSIPGIPDYVTLTVFVIVFFIVISRMMLSRMPVVPGGLQNVMELILEWLMAFCKEVAGEENGRRFFPIVTTIFLFVIANAWLGLLPGFASITITNVHGEHVHLLRAANTDINIPLALALASFIAVGYFGFKSVGTKHFLGQYFNVGRFFRGVGQMFRGNLRVGLGMAFTGIMDIFVGMLELLSVFIRIMSFTFRLFGNMTAGEILLLMVMFLVAWVAALPFYGLELLVGFVQALIFAGLTLVFLTLAATPHEAEAA